MENNTLISVKAGDKASFIKLFTHYSLLVTFLVSLKVPGEKQHDTIKKILRQVYEKILSSNDNYTIAMLNIDVLHLTKKTICHYFKIADRIATENNSWVEMLETCPQKDYKFGERENLSLTEYLVLIVRVFYNMSARDTKKALGVISEEENNYMFTGIPSGLTLGEQNNEKKIEKSLFRIRKRKLSVKCD